MIALDKRSIRAEHGPWSGYRVNGKAMNHPRINIGALSQRTGVNIETIRYYERIALLPSPARTQGGFRQYEDRHIQRLQFIRRGRDLGFSIDSIRALLALSEKPDMPCGDADKMVASHLDMVDRKIADLIHLQEELRQLMDCCGHVVAECRIIESLGAPPPHPRQRPE
jgi:DNA-binding transcriptional MerR regulator